MPSDIVLHDYIAGALGGAAGLVVGHPFDTIKVQLQTQHHGHQHHGHQHQGHQHQGHQHTSTIESLRNIYKYGLVRGFYRGLSWPLMSYGIVNSVFFGVYGHTLKYLEADRSKRTSNYLNVYMAGCVGGAAQLVFVVPVDYIKTALQSHLTNDIKTQGFKGPLQCAVLIYNEKGLFGFYKGGLAMACREVPSYGIYCLSYEFLSTKMHVPSLISGGVAGSLTWASIIPFDVIKSRYQADFIGEYRGFVHCARMLYQEGGFRIFYTGFLVTFLRAFPANAITFSVYAQVLTYLEHKVQKSID